MSICYITAYLDIGRNNWSTFRRTNDQYIQHFLPFVNLFSNTLDAIMIVFIDKRILPQLQPHIPPYTSIHLIPIDDDYLRTNIRGWNYLDIERNIIQSESYRNLVKQRRFCYPENTYAEYTTLTNCKVDFVCQAIQIEPEFDYYCWVDFGYFKLPENIPKNLIDIAKLDSTKINLQLLHPLDVNDQNIIYTILQAPERIAGAFSFGSKENYLRYQVLHHQIQQEFHSLGLVDDDQHITLRCYYRQPELFDLHIHDWSKSLVIFQKNISSNINEQKAN